MRSAIQNFYIKMASGGFPMSGHHVIHIEFSAHDREAAGKFYSDLFGWKISQMPEMDYATFETGNNLGGGLNPVSENYPAGTTLVYIGTDDIEASLAKAESLGGKIITHKTEIPQTGWFGLFTDPTGNMIGLYTPLEGQG
jgi:predicted enzyme related to lactoylglutathione lyase